MTSIAKTKKTGFAKFFFASLIILLVTIIAVIRITGVIKLFNIPTSSDEPAVHVGQKVYFTTLKTAKRGDIIIYTSKRTDSINLIWGLTIKPGTNYSHRLCAVEGDIIQMKEGVFYINGNDFDTAYNLYHVYIVPKKYVEQLPNNLKEFSPPISWTDSTVLINLTDNSVNKFSTQFPITKATHFQVDTSAFAAFAWYNRTLQWSADNFGPLKVPEGCGFVMGDNRNNALDSRYTGFIQLENIKGVKL
jgi:signal peptidase I